MNHIRQEQNKGFAVVSIVVTTFLIGITLLFFTACSQPTEQANDKSSDQANPTPDTTAQYSFTDDLGNEITVSPKPERVVACMGSFARIWELSGGTLVGVTDDALEDYQISSSGVETVGQFTAPNLEQIIALSPDFVIMTSASTGKDGSASQTELKESLEASGITVAYFNVVTFDDYLRMLRVCSDINENSESFETYGSAIEKNINDIVEKAANAQTEKPTVLLMTTYSGGTRVQNSSTMTGAMLSDLGAINLADENKSLLKEFSLESIIEANPDYILVVPMGNDDEAALKNLKEATEANPAWAALDAVKEGKYVVLDKSLFLYKPNEKWDTAYQTLYDILYA